LEKIMQFQPGHEFYGVPKLIHPHPPKGSGKAPRRRPPLHPPRHSRLKRVMMPGKRPVGETPQSTSTVASSPGTVIASGSTEIEFVPATKAEIAGIYGSYGFLGLSKRQRRDRKRRRAQRKMDRYAKHCGDSPTKKAWSEAKCTRYKAKVEKLLGKAMELEEKLAAKGKTTSVSFGPSGELQVASGRSASSVSEAGLPLLQDQAISSDEDELPLEAATPSKLPMIIGAVAGLGIVGTLVYLLATSKKPKKSKKSKSSKSLKKGEAAVLGAPEPYEAPVPRMAVAPEYEMA
jgi:hypothetical protein